MRYEQLHCDDGCMVAAVAIQNSKRKWEIFGVSEVRGMGDGDYEKKLFDMEFDNYRAYNSWSGVSYAAVKRNGLWGLIRFRTKPYGNEYYMKALGSEPIDTEAVDELGREIKLIEEIKYTDIEPLLKKYKINMEETMDKSRNDFDHITWKKQFESASEKGAGFRELRANVFQNTLAVVKTGGYYVDDIFVSIPNKLPDDKSEYFDAPDALTDTIEHQTKYSVVNADCLETAEVLAKAGFNPCVLNLASRQNPGGGVLGGAGAQEENIFRRSNLFLSLYQFASYAREYGVKKHEKSYPLDRNTGGIYSSDITIFRASEQNGYCLLKKPYTVSIVSAPAMNRPSLTERNGLFYIVDKLVEPTKEKIRTILRIAGKYNHDCLVLGAFGCGAFANPPNHMAELFKEVFFEKEFAARFKLVVFSIFEDHNSNKEHNPNGNVLPFLEVFNGL